MKSIDDNIDTFVSVVNNAYRQSFEQQYSGLSTVGGYLIDQSRIREMYESLLSMFPFVHLVLALTVLAPQGVQVGLSQVLSVDNNHTNDGKHDDICNCGWLFFMEGLKDKSSTSDMAVDLSHRKRAVLEFFITKNRIRSRRKLRYWAMLALLGNHSCGHSRNPSSHQLHGVGCSPTLLWTTLNEINETTIPARADLIFNQLTISMVFDNWQMSIKNMANVRIIKQLYQWRRVFY